MPPPVRIPACTTAHTQAHSRAHNREYSRWQDVESGGAKYTADGRMKGQAAYAFPQARNNKGAVTRKSTATGLRNIGEEGILHGRAHYHYGGQKNIEWPVHTNSMAASMCLREYASVCEACQCHTGVVPIEFIPAATK